ncbi:MAG: cupin domain-containing protein [Pseudomonadota bacterium]|nr:cupin domain-containing protein [Pseudomonadota bacterium]
MQLNMDYAARVVVDTAALPWQPSPAPGVERKLLERDGEELARATSLVRYAPGAQFASHRHDAGEEIFVLQGTFADEAGSYAAGTYLKNPPGSSHAPSSPDGCALFVKLRYQSPDDSARIVIDTTTAVWHPGLVEGLTVLPLASHATQHTALVRWAPGTRFTPHRHYGGEEIFVLDGVFEDEHGRYPAGSWLRSPHLSQHRPFSREGCTILVKTGHLPVAAGAA